MKYFDFHCDTISKLYEGRQQNDSLHLDRLQSHVSLEKAAGLSAYGQVFAFWTPVGIGSVAAYQNFYSLLNIMKNELALFGDRIALCHNADEIERNAAKGKTAALLSLEGSRAVMGNLEILHDFYAEGVRLISLSWNERNALCDGVSVNDAGGLTALGRAFVEEIERLGMILDVSHISDRGFWDICEIAKKPFAATHSNSRALCKHRRNLADGMFVEIVKRGGVAGINFCKDFLEDDGERADVTSVVRHIEHFLSLGGSGSVVMGADFDGADMPPDISGIDKVVIIAEEMLKANYPQDLVDNILWGNAVAFIKRVLG